MKRLFILTTIFLITLLQVKVYSPPTWDQEPSLEVMLNQKLFLDFSFLNAAPGSSADKARALYYYVAGPPTVGYPAGHTGPASGLFGLVGDILSHSSMGQAFSGAGISNCDLIPNSGSVSVSDHSEGNLTLSFFPGRVEVPSHFDNNAGSKLTKRIQVDKSNGHLISIEMNCENSNITSGYIVMENGPRVELYYQFNNTTGRQQMDAYMDYPVALGNDNNEKVAMRFESDDTEKFRFWAVRTTDNASEGSLGIAVEGDLGQNHASINVVEDADATADTATGLDAGASSCISLDDNGTTSGCTAVSPPAATVHGNTFNIVGTDSMQVDTIELLRADAPTYDVGTHTLGTNHTQLVTIANVSSVVASTISASGLASPFSFSGGSYPGTGGTCGATLASSSTCQLSIDFSPVAAGAFNDSLILSYAMNGLPYHTTIDFSGVSGAGSPALLTISESDPYNYGSHATGTSNDHSFTVSNTGSQTATALSGSGLASPYSFKGGSYPGTGGTCGASLAPAATCTIEVNYSPVSAAVHNDTIDLAYNDGVAAQTASRSLTGTGTSSSPAVLTISESDPYDYGSIGIGASASHSFTVTNSGSQTATSITEVGLAVPFMFSGGSYPGTGGTCGATITAASSCVIVVDYAPVATGLHTDAIDLSYNNGSSTQSAQRSIQGTGITAALLTISESNPYDYGSLSVGGSSSHTFTISNTGGSAATTLSGSGLASPFNFSGGSYPGISGTCGATLVASATCTVEINYSPISAGVHNDTFELNYNDGVNLQIASRNLTGTGATPALLVISDGATYDYGSHATSTTTSHTFTITNTGGLTATSLSASGLSAPFGFSGGAFPGTGGTCSLVIAPGASCNVQVDFSPISTGAHSDTLDLNYNDGSGAQSASRNVQGTGL